MANTHTWVPLLDEERWFLLESGAPFLRSAEVCHAYSQTQSAEEFFLRYGFVSKTMASNPIIKLDRLPFESLTRNFSQELEHLGSFSTIFLQASQLYTDYSAERISFSMSWGRKKELLLCLV